MIKNQIKIVLWDFGGVLTKSPFQYIKKYEEKNEIPSNSIIKINSINPLENAWAKLEKNLISLQDFSNLYNGEANNLGIKNIVPMELLKCLEAPLNKKIVDVLKLISHKYTCACLTNNVKGFFSIKSKKEFASIKSNFKFVFESSKIGLRKPEKKIYIYVLEKLKVKPENILFIDDLGINLKPAREIGFLTYKFINNKDALKFLKNHLNF